MLTVGFSHKIGPEVATIFEGLHAQLRLSKRETLELMIKVFAALPQDLQDALASGRPGESEAAFDHIRHAGTDESAVDTLAQHAQSHTNRARQKRGPKAAS